MKIVKFIFGRIFVFCACFFLLASSVDVANAIIFSALAMVVQLIVVYSIVLVVRMLSSWFGVECFNKDRFTRTFAPLFISYFFTAVVVAGLAGVK